MYHANNPAPCPDCGANAHQRNREPIADDYTVVMVCVECGRRGPSCLPGDYPQQDDYEAAANAWNAEILTVDKIAEDI